MSHPCMVHHVASIDSIVINTIPSIINPNTNPKTFVINHQTHDTLVYRYHQQATTARDHIKYQHSIRHAISSATRSTRQVARMVASYRPQVVITFVHTHDVPHRSASPGSSFVSCCRLWRTMGRRTPFEKNRKNRIWRSSGSKKNLYVVQSGCVIVLKRVWVP